MGDVGNEGVEAEPAKPRRSRLRRVLLGLLVVALVLGGVVGGYAIYLESSYYRIADNTEVTADNPAVVASLGQLGKGVTYRAVTYNIGFGAYTPDYTFFMDEGVMADGTKTRGTRSRAASQASVEATTLGAKTLVAALKPDFVLFQEVDTNSDRSYHVNQLAEIEGELPAMGAYFTSNFHSSYLAYPLNEPHGTVNAGLLTLCDARVTSAVRRSYPVDGSFPAKYFDLDRCFMVLHVTVAGGNDLVLINSHMSAYDSGGVIRAQQLEVLYGVLSYEQAQGNYVIVGGDWNHALCGSVEMYPSQQQVPSWVATLDDSELPAGFSVARAQNLEEVATCRGDDIPYEKGVTYTTTVDGFIVSSNVAATATNIDTGFLYSDHNPVLLQFTLG